MQPHLLTVITFLPLLGVPALLFLRSDDHVWIRRIALAVVAGGIRDFAVPDCADSITANPGYQFEEFHDWIGSADSLSPGRGRHQPVPRASDDVPDAHFDSGVVGRRSTKT